MIPKYLRKNIISKRKQIVINTNNLSSHYGNFFVILDKYNHLYEVCNLWTDGTKIFKGTEIRHMYENAVVKLDDIKTFADYYEKILKNNQLSRFSKELMVEQLTLFYKVLPNGIDWKGITNERQFDW